MRYSGLVVAAVALALGAALADEAEPVASEPENPNIDTGDVAESVDGNEILSDGKTRKEHAAMYNYCEEKNCYDILGVSRTSTLIAIKRKYRTLAAEWHPDKNPDPKAKAIFQKYSTAYDVLSNSQMRRNYNYLLDNPYDFPGHYMRYGGGANYAAKSDVTTVLILVILVVSALQYYLLEFRRSQMLESCKSGRAYEARIKFLMNEETPLALAGGKPKSGGDRGQANSTKTKKAGSNKDEALVARKAAAEAKFEAEIMEDLPPHPTIADTFIVTLFTAPLTVSAWATNTFSWTLRIRLMGQDYTDSDKEYLTCKATGTTRLEWKGMSDEDRTEYLAEELWDEEKKATYDKTVASAAGSRNAKEKRAARQQKKHGKGAIPMDD